MRLIKYRCEICKKVFVSDDTRHIMHYCPCGKSAVDLEHDYCRFINKVEFVQEFEPPWFEDVDEYHSALLGWLNDSDEEYRLFKEDNILFIEKVK